MPGLDNLIEKISQDASERAAAIARDAESEAEAAAAAREGEAREEAAKLIKKAKEEAAALKAKLISSAELEVRDSKLAAKNEMIQRVLAAARDRLSGMGLEEYTRFLAAKLADEPTLDGAELIVPEKYAGIDLAAISPAVKLRAGSHTKNGFVLIRPNSESNNSFEALLEFHRDELERLTALELF
jgi:V/A-type H+-transporting ATPase subunit E